MPPDVSSLSPRGSLSRTGPRRKMCPCYQDIDSQWLCFWNHRNPAERRMLGNLDPNPRRPGSLAQPRTPGKPESTASRGRATCASGGLAVPTQGEPALSPAYCLKLRMHFPTGAEVRFPGQPIKAHFCFICRRIALLQFFTVLSGGTEHRKVPQRCICRKGPAPRSAPDLPRVGPGLLFPPAQGAPSVRRACGIFLSPGGWTLVTL